MSENEDIIDDIIPIEDEKITFKIASQGERATNFIIDLIFRSLLLFTVGFFGIFLYPDPQFWLLIEEGNLLIEIVIGTISTLLYYTVFEAVTNGKSLGKYITKTRAVKEDASPIGFSGAVLRSLCRIIPFEAFSYLGNDAIGWHDEFSGTLVIKDARWKEWKKSQINLK